MYFGPDKDEQLKLWYKNDWKMPWHVLQFLSFFYASLQACDILW